jgi:hypothetical protein
MLKPLRSNAKQDRGMWLGQVKAALRPSGIDPVEVREVLLAAKWAGQNPSGLYLSAVRDRPPEYESPPPLQKVLPARMLVASSEPETLPDE